MANGNSETSGLEAHSNGNSSEPEAQLHDLLPFTIGERIFAVFAEQVEGTADGKLFARLPHAPNAIIGVVCVRGRMLTVVDPAVVLTAEAANWERTLPYVIALRGDEQLGLVAETCRDTITISSDDIERPTEKGQTKSDFAVGLVMYGGEEMLILDTKLLFTAVVQRRERRRRRF